MFILRARALATALACGAVVLAGCGTGSGSSPVSAGGHQSKGSHGPTAPAPVTASLTSNVARGATGVPVDHRVKVTADHATLSSVTVSSKSGSVPGRMSPDKTS